MSSNRGALLSEPLPVMLLAHEGLEGLKVRFPRQDPRLAHIEDPPRLVVVQSDGTGRQEIAGAKWWGTWEHNPTEIAVEASPKLVRAMAQTSDPSDANRQPAKARRARWRDIALYARGFRTPLFLAALGFLAGMALALVAVLAVQLPVWIAAVMLALVAFVEGAKATASVLSALG